MSKRLYSYPDIEAQRRCRLAGRVAGGFTLVELLVVVGIIGLLLSIIVPAMSKVRQVTQTTICMNSMRGIGMAMKLYAHEHDDQFVAVGFGHGGAHHSPQGAWMITLQQYDVENVLRRCPSDQSSIWPSGQAAVEWERWMDDTSASGPPSDQVRLSSYATNGVLYFPVGQYGPFPKTSMIANPARTIFAVELAETGSYAMADHVHPDTWISDPRPRAAEQITYDRHQGQANYTFVDGSVQTLAFEQTYRLQGLTWQQNKYYPWIAQ